MRVRRSRPWLPLLLATTFFLPAFAVHSATPGPDKDKIHARMQEAAEQLKLTETQKAELKPILEDHVAKVRAIRAKYPAEASRQDKRAMLDEMREVRDDYDAKVRALLTPEQQKEWEKLRAEARERMRERRAHQESGAAG